MCPSRIAVRVRRGRLAWTGRLMEEGEFGRQGEEPDVGLLRPFRKKAGRRPAGLRQRGALCRLD